MATNVNRNYPSTYWANGRMYQGEAAADALDLEESWIENEPLDYEDD